MEPFQLTLFLGAGVGALGRHSQVTPDGIPVFDKRMKVFFEVVTDDPMVAYLTLLT